MTQNCRMPSLDARMQVWANVDFVNRNCPFCNSTGTEKVIRPDGLTVKLCETCGTYFVSPAPSEQAVNDFYQTYSKVQSRGGRLDEVEAELIGLSEPLADFRICEIASVMNLKGKKVLDIGFGKGEMLVKIKKMGAVAEGIDLDSSMVNSVKKYFGLNVSSKTLNELKGEKYDLIMMNDLIEHPFQPFTLLEQANQLLNDKGLLVIYTPNASHAHFEKEPIIFRVDLEHLQYITFRTCQYIAQELKLSQIHLESIGFPRLGGIDKTETAFAKNHKHHLLKIVLKTPLKSGYVILSRYHPLKKTIVNPRLGKYHLFCMYQKYEKI